jgi:hypothetical protein
MDSSTGVSSLDASSMSFISYLLTRNHALVSDFHAQSQMFSWNIQLSSPSDGRRSAYVKVLIFKCYTQFRPRLLEGRAYVLGGRACIFALEGKRKGKEEEREREENEGGFILPRKRRNEEGRT